MTARERALALAERITAKKGLDIRVLALGEVCSFTDFFVIASGTSSRHVKTLADETVEAARQSGERPIGVEGDPPGRWILVDLGDVIVHLFEQEARDFYGLERLWGEAQRVELPEPRGDELAEAAP